MFPRPYFSLRYFSRGYFGGRIAGSRGPVFKVKQGSDRKGQRWATVFVKAPSPPHSVTQFRRLLPPGAALLPQVGDPFMFDASTDTYVGVLREDKVP